MWYVGYSDDCKPEVFESDRPEDATTEASGYQVVKGPFDSEEEAQEELEGLNDNIAEL